MVNLLTANACLAALKKDGIVYSKSYFSQMVSDGKIPTHPKPPSPKNFFYYDEVKAAIEEHKDPSRDAQREANEKRREEPSLINAIGLYPSQADMTDEEKEEIKKIKEDIEKEKKAAIDEGINLDDEDEDDETATNIKGADARAVKEYWLGKKAKIEYKRLKGEYILKKDSDKQGFQTARVTRDALLSLIPRLSPVFAGESDRFKIERLFYEEMNQALSGLCDAHG